MATEIEEQPIAGLGLHVPQRQQTHRLHLGPMEADEGLARQGRAGLQLNHRPIPLGEVRQV